MYETPAKTRPVIHLTTDTDCEVADCHRVESSRITIPGRHVSLCAEHLMTYAEANRFGYRREWMDSHLS